MERGSRGEKPKGKTKEDYGCSPGNVEGFAEDSQVSQIIFIQIRQIGGVSL